ncbi:hypothetical protein [Thermodesulfatator autotrophicus]|uniref:hypothetical protein n=1 Tax=Thermodesulfatator autotrophicus TaxID=1795632 RepID=UPI0012FC6863|nr:hypothetical protein [Thermodesulfatator autotrophicus]
MRQKEDSGHFLLRYLRATKVAKPSTELFLPGIDIGGEGFMLYMPAKKKLF